jgi:hypothetical protein
VSSAQLEPTISAPAIVPPQAPLGRSAALIHGFALLIMVCVVIIGFVLNESEEKLTFMGVGIAAALALGCWSEVLAFRAIRNSEPPRWPVMVFALGMLEASAACILVWAIEDEINQKSIPFARLIVSSGMPVIIPILTVATFISATLAKWWVSRNQHHANTAPVATSLRERGMRAYAISMLLLLTLILPYPLYFHYLACAYPDTWGIRRSGTAAAICKWYPLWFRDSAERLLVLLGRTGNAEHLRMLQSAQISAHRLEQYAADQSQAVANAATRSLIYNAKPNGGRHVSSDGLKYVLRVADGSAPAGPHNMAEAGRILAGNGSFENVIRLLHSQTTDARLQNGLLRGLMYSNRPEFLPELERIEVERPAQRSLAFTTMATLMPEAEAAKQWIKYLASSDRSLRANAAISIKFFSDESEVEVIVAGLTHSDPSVRRMVLNEALSVQLTDHKERIQPALAVALLKLLDDPDIAQRRGAASWLRILLIDPSYFGLEAPTGLKDVEHEIPAPETDEDLDTIEAARKAARECLENAPNCCQF